MKEYNLNLGIKVMAEFCSSGFWAKKGGGMLDLKYLKSKGVKFTKTLESKIEKWIRFLNIYELKIIAEENKEYIGKLNQTGESITEQMQKLNPNYKFYYQSY